LEVDKMKIRNVIVEVLAIGFFIAAVVGIPAVIFKYHVKHTDEHYSGDVIQIIARNDEIEGEPGRWMVQKDSGWNYNDKDAPTEIRVDQGKDVTLLITAVDSVHEFTLTGYDLKKKIYPGKVANISLVTTNPGQYHFECTTYCGVGHDEMVGHLIVRQKEEEVAAAAGL
jgi:heme/copper-type cytochrome/quinol oxidase subunit 2